MSTQQNRLGQYELQERLASDSTSEVWKAFDTQQRRYVALKILHFHAQTIPDFSERFLRETQPLPTLQHPNIAPVIAIHPPQELGSNEAYLVMDYIQGQPLSDYIHATAHSGNFPPPNEIIRIITPIASAIDYAHQRGIIHGAIRPNNILLDKQNISPENPLGEPKLIGFGSNTTQPLLALSVEEVYYVAPERVQGHTENARSDIYSLGVILYEMCTGTPPFQGDAPNDILMQHLHATPTSPALINPGILPSLTAVILRSLSKDPVSRFPTATSLALAAARALNQPVPDYLSQSGVYRSGSMLNLSSSGSTHSIDEMNSPTYFSPLVPPPVVPPLASQSSPMHTPVINTGPQQSGWSQPQPVPQYNNLRTTPAANATQTYPPPPMQKPAAPPPTRPRRGWLIALIAILLVAILGSVAAVYLFNIRGTTIIPPAPAPANVVGHAYFVSSGQVNEQTTQGTADRLQVDLQNIPAPASGKQYYIWLLGDNDTNLEITPILLGMSAQGGHINISYPGNASHDDLLATYSRFLVTEQDAGIIPTNPSLDINDQRYYSAISQGKASGSPYSLLDHERHLLSQDPKLKAVGLVGGLDTWLFRNTLKILEYAGSARDAKTGGGGVPFMQRQLVRILDYLDGSQYVRTEKLPPGLPAVMIDPVKARVALLEFDTQNQVPPGYLTHIGNHLREIAESPGVTPEQKALAIRITIAIDNVQSRLKAVQRDAQQLLQMTPQQLQQPQGTTLLNDLFIQANYAFVGQIDPNTSQVKEGVVQIHDNILRLTTFNIQPGHSRTS